MSRYSKEVVTVVYLLWSLPPLCVLGKIHLRLITFKTCFVGTLFNVFTEDKIMKPFPRRARKRIDKGVYNTFKYAIYCSCRQPKDTGRMIECEVCQKWFHEDSVVVPLDVWKSDNLSWKCNVCN